MHIILQRTDQTNANQVGRLGCLKSYNEQTKLTKTRGSGVSCLKFYREQTKVTHTISGRLRSLKSYKINGNHNLKVCMLKILCWTDQSITNQLGPTYINNSWLQSSYRSISSLLRDKLWLMATSDTIRTNRMPEQIECCHSLEIFIIHLAYCGNF